MMAPIMAMVRKKTDFSIQFGVRYRAERYEVNNMHAALSNAARHVGVPLTLAGTATALGFLSFLPTAYRGLSELGQIAGLGMIIAFLVSIFPPPSLPPSVLTGPSPPSLSGRPPWAWRLVRCWPAFSYLPGSVSRRDAPGAT